jgi:hypothetical protein
MRVDYTLPALQPGTLAEDTPAAGEMGSSFREQLRTSMVQLPITCEQQLRLDVRPFTGTYIGAPPRPKTLEISDAETQRVRWRSMLSRHGRTFESTNGSGGQRPVQGMLKLLQDMQQAEDSIVSQNASLTRG